jgi:hypothetical protein
VLPLSENALDELVARERDRGAPPLTDWSSLSATLRAEGLIKTPAITSRFTSSNRWMQIAAGLAIAVGGAAIGRATAGAPVIPASTVQTASNSIAPPGDQQSFNTPVSASQSDPVTGAEQGASNVSTSASFKSPDEAWEVLNRSGAEYQRASAYLSSTGNTQPMPTEPSQYRTRLAALDNVMQEMRGALKDAPHDPVINQYYRATVGVREATLRQLGTTLPAGAKLNRF